MFHISFLQEFVFIVFVFFFLQKYWPVADWKERK